MRVIWEVRLSGVGYVFQGSVRRVVCVNMVLRPLQSVAGVVDFLVHCQSGWAATEALS